MQYRIKFGAVAAVALLATTHLATAIPLNTISQNHVTILTIPADSSSTTVTETTTTTTMKALDDVENIPSDVIMQARGEQEDFPPLTKLSATGDIWTAVMVHDGAQVTAKGGEGPIESGRMFTMTISDWTAVMALGYPPESTGLVARGETTMTPLDRIQMIPTEVIMNPRAETTMSALERIQMIPTEAIMNPRAETTMTPLDRIQMIPTEAIMNPRAETTMSALDRIQMIPTEAIMNPRAESTATPDEPSVERLAHHIPVHHDPHHHNPHNPHHHTQKNSTTEVTKANSTQANSTHANAILPSSTKENSTKAHGSFYHHLFPAAANIEKNSTTEVIKANSTKSHFFGPLLAILHHIPHFPLI